VVHHEGDRTGTHRTQGGRPSAVGAAVNLNSFEEIVGLPGRERVEEQFAVE
jgi:hypothetical protein